MTCTRSSHKLYLFLEQGEEDTHAATCPECGPALAVALAMREALPSVGADRLPPAGWQTRLLDQLEGRAPLARPVDETPWWRRRWWIVALPAALATAAALLVLWPRDGMPPGATVAELRLEMAVRPEAGVQRARGAAVGDVVVLRASGAEAQTVLWVYRGPRDLVLRCPGQVGCRGQGPSMEGDLRVDRPGEYHALLASSAEALPPPGATLDESISSLGLARARYKMIDFEVF